MVDGENAGVSAGPDVVMFASGLPSTLMVTGSALAAERPAPGAIVPMAAESAISAIVRRRAGTAQPAMANVFEPISGP